MEALHHHDTAETNKGKVDVYNLSETSLRLKSPPIPLPLLLCGPKATLEEEAIVWVLEICLLRK